MRPHARLTVIPAKAGTQAVTMSDSDVPVSSFQ